jgi:hypothetical protein
MAVFGPYTQPVKPAEWVDPLDLNMYAKGMAYKQQLAEENLKKFTDKFSSAFNLPAYGVDAQQLSKLEQDFKNNLDSLNLSNLSDMSTVSQMNGLINQYTSGATKEGKDLMAIAKRGSFYQSESKKQQEAEEKGLPFYSRGFQELQNYYNGTEFFTDPKDLSLNSGFVGVNLSKERNEALKNVPKEKYLKNGRYYERYNQDALNEALNMFYTDQRVQKQIQYDIEEKWKDKDWETEGINQISSYKQEAQNLYNEAVKAGRQDIAQDALNDITTYDKMIQDPKGYSEQIKTTVYNEELQNRINTDKEHANFNSVDKADEYAMKAQDLANTKAAKLYDMQLKTGIMRNANESESAYMTRLAEGAYEKDLEIARAKQEIKTEAQLAVEAAKQTGKEKLATMKFDQALSKVPKGQKTPASKAIVNLAQGAVVKGDDEEEIVKTLVKQNWDKFVKEFKDRFPDKGIADEEDKEGVDFDDDGNIAVEFDITGGDWFGDTMTLSQEEVADILSDEPSQEPTTATTTQKPATFDKSKLDAKTLKALEDNIKANPGASEEEVAKAMKLI